MAHPPASGPNAPVPLSNTSATPPEGGSLLSSEIRFRRLFEAAQDGILMLDAVSGEITAANPFLATLLGYSDAELLGRKLWEISPFDDAGKSRIAFEELQSLDYIRYDDLPLQTRDGRAIDVEFVSNIYMSGTDRVIQCNIRDITDRNATKKAKQASDDRYRVLFDHAPDGILIADPTGRYIDVNPSMCRMLGYSRDELIGLSAADIVTGDEASHISAAMTSIADHAEYRREWQFLSKSAKVVSADVMATAMPDGNLLAIVRDVTERHALEAQFRQAQKMEAVGRLAGGVAHDFNNLLTVILGFCEMMLSSVSPRDPIRSDIAQIQAAGLRAAGLTRQLLAFSRKEIVEPTLLDLNTILTTMEPMLARLIRENVHITCCGHPDLPCIKADRGQVEQVIVNLAVNAQDAMPDGGTLKIDAAATVLDERYASTHLNVVPGPYVVLTVADTGTGMTPDVLAHLFEPFFTTKPMGKGTGLGLATVHGIVTRSGGSVAVDSVPSVGSSFKVYFPQATEGVAPLAVPDAVVEPETGREHVLVVEDDDGLRELTRRLLVQQGYSVQVASNGAAALRVFEANPAIDVLLTDVVMPGRSGPDLAKELVRLRPGLKVIYMSGYNEEAVIHHGVINPGIEFLHKPFTAHGLGTKIRAVLRTT
jgi:PAS domain S-box-containing protein